MPVTISGSGTVTGLASGNAGVGKVLQVVQATTNSAVATTSTSYVDTNLTASITPSSTDSKILVLISQVFNVGSSSNGTHSIGVAIDRGGTTVYEVAGSNNQIYGALGHRAGTGSGGYTEGVASISINYLDAPASTSALTYKTQFKVDVNATTNCRSQNYGTNSSIILLEVAA
jgi:hypothetical protein